jgi:HEAT repeat protein
LQNPDPKVRAQAADAIGDRGKATPAVEALRQALTDANSYVQYRVAVAIGMITGQLPPKPMNAATTIDEQAAGQVDHKTKAKESDE